MVFLSQAGDAMNARIDAPAQMQDQQSRVDKVASQVRDGSKTTPTIAFFTLPKPFDDPHIACIQRNAIASWQAIGENTEIILIGDEAGIADAALALDVTHVGHVRRNKHGTPLVNDAFEIARKSTTADLLVYCNADVILLQDFHTAMTQVMRGDLKDGFLAIGRRTNLNVSKPVNLRDRTAVAELMQRTAAEGELAPIVCKEYFAFPRDQFETLPPFAVGRGNWDNWMVADTKKRHIPVVDVSNRVTAIHQNHDYQHVASNQDDKQVLKLRRKHCYLSGPEARENQRLANGKHIIAGSTSSHRLAESGVVKVPWSWLNLNFWTDLPRFAQLVRQLFFG